jgi:hypothetical protein
MLPRFFLALEESNLWIVVKWKHNGQLDNEIVILG